jgi:hypothetical protein
MKFLTFSLSFILTLQAFAQPQNLSFELEDIQIELAFSQNNPSQLKSSVSRIEGLMQKYGESQVLQHLLGQVTHKRDQKDFNHSLALIDFSQLSKNERFNLALDLLKMDQAPGANFSGSYSENRWPLIVLGLLLVIGITASQRHNDKKIQTPEEDAVRPVCKTITICYDHVNGATGGGPAPLDPEEELGPAIPISNPQCIERVLCE